MTEKYTPMEIVFYNMPSAETVQKMKNLNTKAQSHEENYLNIIT